MRALFNALSAFRSLLSDLHADFGIVKPFTDVVDKTERNNNNPRGPILLFNERYRRIISRSGQGFPKYNAITRFNGQRQSDN